MAGLALFTWGPGLASAALGALVVVAGAWRCPLSGPVGVAAFLPFYLFARPIAGFSVSASEAALLLSAGAGVGRWLTRRGHSGQLTTALRSDPADIPIVLFLVAAMLSLVVTEYTRLSLRELRVLVVEPVLFYCLLRVTAQTPRQRWTVTGTLLAATTLVALVSVGQFLVGGAVTEVQGVRRVQGTYLSPNHLGLLLGRCIPFLVAAAWLLPSARRLVLPAVALCMLALTLSFSLGGWLGTGAALIVVAAALGGKRPSLVLIGIFAAAALLALFVLRVERVAGHLDPTQGTTLVRLRLWEAALDMLRDQPLLGIGLDNFLYGYPSHLPGLSIEPHLSHPHNFLLHFWLSLGLAGVAALIWLLVLFARHTFPDARYGVPVETRALAAGAIGSMTDFLIHGSLDNSYFLMDMAFIFWLTIAMGLRPSAVTVSSDTGCPVGDGSVVYNLSPLSDARHAGEGALAAPRDHRSDVRP